MKKTVLFGSIIGFVSLFLLWQLLLLDGQNISSAQTSDLEYQKLLERDRGVAKEKIEKAFAEAKKIQDDILRIMAEKKMAFTLNRTFASHLIYDSPGRRGATHNEMTWQKKKTRLSVNFQLEFNEEETRILFRKGLQSISMGDFFEIPKLGDEAVLVKNVLFNKRMTGVGLHFVKGRAQVHVRLDDHERGTAKNEKELMEVVRLIEPLIIARPNFDDL